MSNHNHSAEPAKKRDLEEMRQHSEAFALETYDEGRPAALDWIAHPGLVQQLAQQLAAERFVPQGINCALTQRIYVRTDNGRVLRFSIAEVREGSPGYIVLADGYVPATHALRATIEAAYQIHGYDSDHAKRSTVGGPLAQLAAPAQLPKEGATEIALYVYQDNDAASWNKEYAELHALSARTEAFGIDGLASLQTELARLAKGDIVVKVLVIAAHGTQAVFRIGKEDEPFQSAGYVGFYKNQIAPDAFAKALKPYLAKGAQIVLATCKTAGDGGTKVSSGSEMIQQMSDDGAARVTGADGLVYIDKAQASTPGNLWVATPGEGTPKIVGHAPAGNINPPAP